MSFKKQSHLPQGPVEELCEHSEEPPQNPLLHLGPWGDGGGGRFDGGKEVIQEEIPLVGGEGEAVGLGKNKLIYAQNLHEKTGKHRNVLLRNFFIYL